jgi:hypothetical protein
MVHFRVADTAEAMRLGKEAAAAVSKAFPNPIKLEFEKASPFPSCVPGSLLAACHLRQFL